MYRNLILDFAHNFLFDNMFWVAEIIISTKKITLIDYQRIKCYPIAF